MITVRGLKVRQLDRWVSRVETATSQALRASLDAVTVRANGQVILSDGAPQGAPQPPPTITVEDLGQIAVVWRDQLESSIMPLVAEVYQRAGDAVAESVTSAVANVTVPVVPATATKQYVAEARNRLSGVGDTAWDIARDQLIAGVQRGESSAELAARITGVHGLTEARAMTVARTEVIGAANGGAYAQVQATGMEGTHEWLATIDTHTRESHALANGQVVPIGGYFTVGDSRLRFPGDPDGDAGEIVNCRCDQVFNLDEETGGLVAAEEDALTAATNVLAGVPNVEGVDENVDADYDGDTDEDISAEQQEEHTGAMVALIPSEADLDRFSVVASEPREELHLTLYFLGEAVQYTPATRMAVIDAVQACALGQTAITANVFGVNVWNPDQEACTVLAVSGDQPERVRDELGEALEDVWAACLPAQHCPWVPHITLSYSVDAGMMTRALGLVGPVTFDRIRIAFGGEVTDVPLYGGSIVASGTEETVTEPLQTESLAATGQGTPVGNTPPPMGQDSMAAVTGTSWEGILVMEGVETGDGRVFAEGSLTWDQPPLALRWTPTDMGEHQGAVLAARIDQVWRDQANPTIIRGSGVFDDSGVNGAEALRLVRGQFLKGVSVDVDSIKDSDVEFVFPDGDSVVDDTGEDDGLLMLFGPAPEKMIFHAGRIRAATLVDIPAFSEAQIWLTDGTMPMATSSPAPTGGYSVNNLFAHNCDGDVNITACAVGISALLRDSKLSLTVAQRREHYEHLAEHVRSAGLTPLPFEEASFSDDVAALVAGLVPVDTDAPPAEWFDDPQLDGPTPLTITDDGRIFGHGALWGTSHTGFADASITPPREGEHVYFRQGELVCKGGERVAVGKITLGTGHAPTFATDPRRAVEHYDNTGSAVADVASGEDRWGIWISGALRPGITAARLRELRSAQLSGDWRRIGGKLRLVAFLAVNVPGFPVPRLTTEVNRGKQLALVASGVVGRREAQELADRDAIGDMRRRLQARVGRTPAQRAAMLRGKVHGGS